MFWIVFVILVLLASLFVLVPLLRYRSHTVHQGEAERNAANLAIYQDRLAEIEADKASGVIDEDQFDELKLEMSRTLLADVSDDARAGNAQAAGSWRSATRLVPLVLLLAIVPLSYVLYEQWGFQDELTLRELHERTQAVANNPEQAVDLVYELTDFIDANRDNGWAWYFLAQNLTKIGQYNEVSIALERASALMEHPQDKAFLLGSYALNEYMLARQQMNDKIRGIIEEAQRLDPNQLFVLQIQALDAEQTGDTQGAITYWQRVLQMAPSGEEADFLRNHIAQLEQSLTATSEPGAGPVIEVAVSLADSVDLAPGTRVFVSALQHNGRGQPLAARSLTVAELPATISLTNADAVGPFNLSSADMIYVVATASVSGTANVQAGDYQARSEPFQHAGTHAIIDLQISEPVAP